MRHLIRHDLSGWRLLGSALLALVAGPGCDPGGMPGPMFVHVMPLGGGRVVSSPAGIDCGATCSAEFLVYQVGTVSLQAIADPGWIFTGWGVRPDCPGVVAGSTTANPLPIAVTQDTNVACSAHFTPMNPVALTVATAGPGAGAVTGQGIQCGNGWSTCASTYAAGTSVTLTATPAGTSSFTGWTGCDALTGNRCTVVLSADRTVTATFGTSTPAPAELRVGIVPQGSVSVNGTYCTSDCSLFFAPGTALLIVAVPQAGWHLDHWTGGCPSSYGTSCDFTIGTSTSITAYFVPDLPNLLTVTKSGTGAGTVYGTNIACGGTCTDRFATGAAEPLTAVPDAGSHFVEWTGHCSGIDTGTFVDMTGDRTCNAVFDLGPGPARDVLAAGSGHTCLIDPGGTVSCWGLGAYLGNGLSTGSLAPVTVVGIPGGRGPTAVSLAAGGSHTCALLSNKTVVCWGANSNGELGDGTTSAALTPVPATGVSTAMAIGTGALHTCAVLQDTSVWCWGANHRGTLGRGTLTYTAEAIPAPVMVDATTPLSGVRGANGSNNHTCAAMRNGGVKCWGLDAYGELGTGGASQLRTYADTNAATPAGVAGVASGGAFGGTSCALIGGGTASCWGYGTSGQLGNGLGTSSSTPVAVQGLGGAVGGVVGMEHACALLSAGGVLCWGDSSVGQIGDGQGGTRLSPASVMGISTALRVGSGPSARHTCAVLRDRTVWCWGSADRGQLGNMVSGAGSNSRVPVQVMGL